MLAGICDGTRGENERERERTWQAQQRRNGGTERGQVRTVRSSTRKLAIFMPGRVHGFGGWADSEEGVVGLHNRFPQPRAAPAKALTQTVRSLFLRPCRNEDKATVTALPPSTMPPTPFTISTVPSSSKRGCCSGTADGNSFLLFFLSLCLFPRFLFLFLLATTIGFFFVFFSSLVAVSVWLLSDTLEAAGAPLLCSQLSVCLTER